MKEEPYEETNFIEALEFKLEHYSVNYKKLHYKNMERKVMKKSRKQ